MIYYKSWVSNREASTTLGLRRLPYLTDYRVGGRVCVQLGGKVANFEVVVRLAQKEYGAETKRFRSTAASNGGRWNRQGRRERACEKKFQVTEFRQQLSNNGLRERQGQRCVVCGLFFPGEEEVDGMGTDANFQDAHQGVSPIERRQTVCFPAAGVVHCETAGASRGDPPVRSR